MYISSLFFSFSLTFQLNLNFCILPQNSSASFNIFKFILSYSWHKCKASNLPYFMESWHIFILALAQARVCGVWNIKCFLQICGLLCHLRERLPILFFNLTSSIILCPHGFTHLKFVKVNWTLALMAMM